MIKKLFWTLLIISSITFVFFGDSVSAIIFLTTVTLLNITDFSKFNKENAE